MDADDQVRTTKVLQPPEREERGLAHDAIEGLVVGGGLEAGKLFVDAAAGAIKDKIAAPKEDGPKIVLPPNVDVD